MSLELLKKLLAFTLILFSGQLLATVIQVTNNAGDSSDGSLGAAILQAGDGDIIDRSPIAGQTIGIGLQFPAMGNNLTSPTATLTILGSGVTIDGGGSRPAFSLANGSAIITDFIIQNGLSQGGQGGSGKTGGGGGTGGGGALYIHSGTTMTILL